LTTSCLSYVRLDLDLLMLRADGYHGLTWMILPNYLSAFRAAAVLSAGCRSKALNIEKIEGIWNRFVISIQPDDTAI